MNCPSCDFNLQTCPSCGEDLAPHVSPRITTRNPTPHQQRWFDEHVFTAVEFMGHRR